MDLESTMLSSTKHTEEVDRVLEGETGAGGEFPFPPPLRWGCRWQRQPKVSRWLPPDRSLARRVTRRARLCPDATWSSGWCQPDRSRRVNPKRSFDGTRSAGGHSRSGKRRCGHSWRRVVA